MNHKSNYETGVEVLWNIGDEISPLLLRKQIKIFCTILVAESPKNPKQSSFPSSLIWAINILNLSETSNMILSVLFMGNIGIFL